MSERGDLSAPSRFAGRGGVGERARGVAGSAAEPAAPAFAGTAAAFAAAACALAFALGLLFRPRRERGHCFPLRAAPVLDTAPGTAPPRREVAVCWGGCSETRVPLAACASALPSP